MTPQEELNAALKSLGFPLLAGLSPQQVYETLAGICAQEGKAVSVDQMLRYAPAFESDLEHSRLTSGF